MSFEEFLSIFVREKKNAKNVSAQQFIDTLGVFDKDNAGRVSSGELRHVLTALGEFGYICSIVFALSDSLQDLTISSQK